MTDAEHKAWARERKLEQQRSRRSRSRRIDYYASPEADEIIDRMRRNGPGGDASSIINLALIALAESRRRKGFRNKVAKSIGSREDA